MVLKRCPRKGFESAFEDTALKPAPNQPLLVGDVHDQAQRV